MQTILATIIDANGVVVCENTDVRTHIPVSHDDPTWSGSFHFDRGLRQPPRAGDTIWLRTASGDETPAMVAYSCFGEIYFYSRDRDSMRRRLPQKG